jgi:integrase
MAESPARKAESDGRSERVGDRVRIFQRGGYWWINYSLDGKQVRRSLKTTSKKQALTQARKIDVDLSSGRCQTPQAAVLLNDAITAFLATKEIDGCRPKTINHQRTILGRLSAVAQSRRVKELRGVTSCLVDAYRKAAKEEGRSGATIHGEVGIIKQLLKFAVRRQMLAANPLKDYKFKRPPGKPQPCWTITEVQNILASATRYREVFQILAETGMRIGELVHLTWEDVNFDNNVVRIRPKWIGPSKSEFWRPKTGDQRAVPMSLALAKLFRQLPQRGRFVFTSSTRDGRLNARTALTHLKKVLEKQGLQGHLHTFRHSFISNALLQGVPEAVVRTWVGQVDARILRRYTHIADAESQAQMKKLQAGGANSAA